MAQGASWWQIQWLNSVARMMKASYSISSLMNCFCRLHTSHRHTSSPYQPISASRGEQEDISARWSTCYGLYWRFAGNTPIISSILLGRSTQMWKIMVLTTPMRLYLDYKTRARTSLLVTGILTHILDNIFTYSLQF